MAKRSYPYIPNSAPDVQAQMLKEIGAGSIDELMVDIPEDLKIKGKMNLPEPCLSEVELKRHVDGILSKNRTSVENISFLGAGSYNHYVPAVVDEVITCSEFLTAYAGEPYEDHGRFQALFEYESMMAELLDVEVCNVPTYDGAQAAATSLRMASRIVKRDKVLLSSNMNPDRLEVIKTYLAPDMEIQMIDYHSSTGLVNIDDLKEKINDEIAAVYIENPAYLGVIETEGQAVADLAHSCGALFVVYVDPSSLGVLNPPSRYGADITCGDIQPLGVHMSYGAGAGFIATSDEPHIVQEYPSRLFSIGPTDNGEWGFGDVLWDRTSFASRDSAKEFVGTHAALWGIAAAVYMSLMGPQGMVDLGKTVMQRSLYARKKLGSLEGVSTDRLSAVSFCEFVVDFNETGKTVEEINSYLLEKGIFGGKDLSVDFPELGQSALYCVTEVVTAGDIDALVDALQGFLAQV